MSNLINNNLLLLKSSTFGSTLVYSPPLSLHHLLLDVLLLHPLLSIKFFFIQSCSNIILKGIMALFLPLSGITVIMAIMLRYCCWVCCEIPHQLGLLHWMSVPIVLYSLFVLPGSLRTMNNHLRTLYTYLYSYWTVWYS